MGRFWAITTTTTFLLMTFGYHAKRQCLVKIKYQLNCFVTKNDKILKKCAMWEALQQKVYREQTINLNDLENKM